MYRHVFLRSAALAGGLFSFGAAAQQVSPAPSAPGLPQAQPAAVTAMPAPAAAVAPLCAGCVAVPSLTPVRIELLTDLGSKISKSGDTFPIRLAEPIVVDGKEIVPAGVTGMGEVIHAKKAGGSGAPGELVLAARYLDIGGGRKLLLRSMHVATSGKSKIDTVNTINVASAAAMPALSLIGFFMSGGQAVVPAGTVADAKTAELAALVPGSVVAPPPVATPAPVAPPSLQPASQEKGK